LNRIECHFWAYVEFVIRGSDYPSHDQLAQATRGYLRHRNSAHRDSRIRILETGARLPDTPPAAVDQVGQYDVDQSVLAADGAAGLARSAAPAACPGWWLAASERTALTEFHCGR
jgi:hypothetical protein